MNDNPDTGQDTAAADAPGYRVLARKYRPQTFDDLIGQDAMVRTLRNAFETGRIAQAYMLTGVRGIGKTTTARLIARALNYTGADKPTVEMPGLGEHCAAILESRHVDVIEMDAASKTGIDDVREIIDSVRYRPISARYKVYIIDEVHMLSKQAFNALLKTLEEPPEHVKFIFATTEIRKVPVTVLSRCQRFDLHRLDAAMLRQHFANVCEREQVSADDESLAMIARAAEGSVRDGLSLLDQAIAYGGREVKGDDVQAMLGLIDQARVIDLFEAVMRGDAATALTQLEEQYAAGADPYTLLTDLARFTHWVTRLKIVPDDGRSGHTETERKRGAAFAESLAMPHLTRAWQMLTKGLQELTLSANPLMTAEMVLIRLAHVASLPPPGDLVARLKDRPSPVASSTSGAPPGSVKESPSAAPTAITAQPAPGLPPAAAQAAFAVQSDDTPGGVSKPVLETFHQVVDFVGVRRDIKLKSQLERLVRPVAVSAGSIEIALEPHAPPGLPGELSRKLEAWTGERWIVLVSKKDGDKPLHQQKREHRKSLFDDAGRNADVRAALNMFPGAEIVDVAPPPDGLDESLPGEDADDT